MIVAGLIFAGFAMLFIALADDGFDLLIAAVFAVTAVMAATGGLEAQPEATTVAPAAEEEYDPDLFGRWRCVDYDCGPGCIDTREEAILRWSTSTSRDGCRLNLVTMNDPYTGTVFKGLSSEIDMDHVVPRKEAWVSGIRDWQREDFMNDPMNLIPTFAAVNRAKGERDPAEWLPPDHHARCIYVALWKEIKRKYDLSMDSREFWAIAEVEAQCR